jgi:hypothetical protein
MPNPKGKDSGNEWIELYNPTSASINLQGWAIANSKKTKKIENSLIIQPQETLILEKDNLKVPLVNTNGKVILLDSSNNKTDEITYDKAPEGLSINKIPIISKTKTYYTIIETEPTKNIKNKEYYETIGIITTPPSTKNPFVFEAQISKTKTASFIMPKQTNPYLSLLLFKQNTKFQAIIEKNESGKYKIIKILKLTNNK